LVDDQVTTVVIPGAGVIDFSDAKYYVNEDGDAVAEITLNRSNGSEGEVSVTLDTTDKTTTVLDDYQLLGNGVTFASGEISKTVTIAITDDLQLENDEALQLTLNNATNGAVIGSNDTATLTIFDNDVNRGLTLTNLDNTVTIDNSRLSANTTGVSNDQVVYTLTDLPDNGSLEISDGGFLNLGDTFTQEDIDSDRLIYTPNSSSGIQDSLSFTLTNGEINASEQTFNIAHPVDLSNWQQQGVLSNGNWAVSGDINQFVTQYINGNPTFFVSPFNFINGTVTGTIRVNTSSDDDYIGFVFGYQSPIIEYGDPTNDYQFLLFDWKQGNQGSGLEGFALSRLESPVSPDLWGRIPSEGFEILATDYSTTKGWVDYRQYEFSLTYTTDRILIKIDNQTIFDVDGTFDPGRFGFYNLSQANVSYGNFRASGLFNEIAIATPDNYSATEDETLIIPASLGLLNNDISPSLGTISVYEPELITTTLNGTITVNADGSFDYTPNPNFAGQDSFSYRVYDGVNVSSSATVTLTVANIDNDAPTDIQLSSTNIDENSVNGTPIGDLTIFDPDPDDTHTLTLVDDA
ncbi:MAG: Ig-like domain-containing protein, partial [Crocosphaera sp.]